MGLLLGQGFCCLQEGRLSLLEVPLAGHFPAFKALAELLADVLFIVAGKEGDLGADFLEAFEVAAEAAFDAG